MFWYASSGSSTSLLCTQRLPHRCAPAENPQTAILSGLIWNSSAPVAYTHLDVYKRQAGYSCSFAHCTAFIAPSISPATFRIFTPSGSQPLPDFLNSSPAGVRITCLLYTSYLLIPILLQLRILPLLVLSRFPIIPVTYQSVY